MWGFVQPRVERSVGLVSGAGGPHLGEGCWWSSVFMKACWGARVRWLKMLLWGFLGWGAAVEERKFVVGWAKSSGSLVREVILSLESASRQGSAPAELKAQRGSLETDYRLLDGFSFNLEFS